MGESCLRWEDRLGSQGGKQLDKPHSLGGQLIFKEGYVFDGLSKTWVQTLTWHLLICPPWAAHNLSVSIELEEKRAPPLTCVGIKQYREGCMDTFCIKLACSSQAINTTEW